MGGDGCGYGYGYPDTPWAEIVWSGFCFNFFFGLEMNEVMNEKKG